MSSFSAVFTRRQAIQMIIAGGGAISIPGLLRAGDNEFAGSTAALSRFSTAGRRWAVGGETQLHRLGLMRNLMDREKLDALVFTSGLYFKFAANFGGFSGGNGLCLLPRQGAPFVMIPKSSENRWRYQERHGKIWVKDVEFVDPEDGSYRDLLVSKIEGLGLGRSRIGVESEDVYLASDVFSDMQIESMWYHIDELRLVKSEEEVLIMEQAASLADWVQERYRENIRPGRLVGELDASMAALGYAEATRRYPEADVIIPCWTLSGPISASPHGAGNAFGNLSGAKVERGHMLVNNV